MKPLDVDNIMDVLGKPGKLQSFSFFFLCANLWFVMSNHMSSVFFTAKTEYSCKAETNTSSRVLAQLATSDGKARTSVLAGANECFLVLVKGNGSMKTKCSRWTYHLAHGETTIISEFDLVCDNAYKSDLTTTIYFAGVMMGGIVFGIMADKFGRKRIIMLTLLLCGIVSVATFVLRTFVVFIILRFFLGFFMQGVQNSSFILALEILSMNYRAHGGLLFCLSGVVGVLLLDLLAYVIRDWKYVQLFTGLLPFILIFTTWFVPESLRWNIVQKNFNRAEAIIDRIVTFNKLPFPRKLYDEIKNNALKEEYVQDEHKGNIIDVFKSPKLRKISFTLFLSWFTFSTVFYGLAFHISFLFGDKYLNFAISCILDAIGVSTLLWIVPRYGRRRPLSIAFFVCAVANAVCSAITVQSDSIKLLGTAMALLGKTAISCCGTIGYIITSELYPTVVRNVSLGMNTFWTRVGGMAAPQIFFLGIYSSAYVPYTVLSALTLLCGILTLLLPETRNKGFADRLEVSMTSLLSSGERDVVTDQSDSDSKKPGCYETSI